MQTVSSAQNPRIRLLRELRHRKGRQAQGACLVEGDKLVAEALRWGRVVTVLADTARADALAPLLLQAGDVLLAPGHVVASVCEAKTPQGIVASVRLPYPLDLDAARGPLLVLDGVQDPGNVGTMLRTAEAAGFTAALLSPGCADAFAPKTVRATMGAIFRVPLWRGALAEALGGLQGHGYTLVASAMDGVPLHAALRDGRLPPGRVALVVGSEGQGISQAIAAQADLRVSLPMRGHAESLNAAVAAGILMYSIMEHRHAD